MVHDVDILLVWLVSLAVVASVAWLALHGWRQGRVLRRWASGNGFEVRARGGPGTERLLEPFRRDDEQIVRELGRVREVVELDAGVRILRCEERVDLTPWSSGAGPAKTRVAAVFPAEEGEETYSVFGRDARPTSSRPPGLRFADPAVAEKLRRRIPGPPHPLSVTLSEGRGLVYLLTPSGDVSADDLDYLAEAARRLAGGASDGGADRGGDPGRGPCLRRGAA